MAGCKVRSGKPGRFEHKKGGERGGIPAESWSKQRADGNLGRKKGPFTVRLRSGGCGERKKEEPWGRQAEGSERDAVYRNGSGSAPVRAQGRERNAVSVLGEKTERGCSDEGGEKEGAFGKIQERNRNFAGLRG